MGDESNRVYLDPVRQAHLKLIEFNPKIGVLANHALLVTRTRDEAIKYVEAMTEIARRAVDGRAIYVCRMAKMIIEEGWQRE